MNKKIYSDQIWQFQNQIKNVTYGKNIPFSVVRLIFLKYVVDNNLCATTKEDFLYNSLVYKMFAARNIDGGPNELLPVLSRVDSEYKLNGLLKESIQDYSRDLFLLDDSWTRKNISSAHLQELMGEIAAINLQGEMDEYQTHLVGKEIVETLLELIENYSKNYIKSVADFSTQSVLCKLASELLKVQDGEVFVDFTSGVGNSTIRIVRDKQVEIFNVELSKETAAVASMLYIMSGYEFSVIVDDGLQTIHQEWLGKADKVFADHPIKSRIMTSDNRKKDSSELALDRAIEYLGDNGVAVVPVPSGVLFGASKSEVVQRRKLLQQGYVQGVISLPPCWSGTNVPTNLIVLSKKASKDVLFINASSNDVFEYFDKKSDQPISDEGIRLIKQQYEDRKDIVGASKVISTQDLLENDCNLVPVRYIEPKITKVEDCSVEEINQELAKLYALFEKK